MLNSRYVLNTLRWGGRGAISSESTIKFQLFAVHCSCGPLLPLNTTPITTALHVRVVRSIIITEQSTSRLNAKYKSKRAMFHFGFGAQQNPLNKKVIRVAYNTLPAAGYFL